MSNSLAVLLLLPVFCQWLTALSRKSWWYILGIVVIKKCLLYYSFNYSIDDDEPIYIFNIDTFRYGFEKPDWVESVDGYLEVFEGEGDHWSFIAVDDDDRVIKTTEKQRISNLCSDGLYYFKSKQQYLSLFQQAIAQQLTVNNEYYIAPMYNLLIAQGGRVGYVKITEDDIDFCGTPDEYQALKAQGLKIEV